MGDEAPAAAVNLRRLQLGNLLLRSHHLILLLSSVPARENRSLRLDLPAVPRGKMRRRLRRLYRLQHHSRSLLAL